MKKFIKSFKWYEFTFLVICFISLITLNIIFNKNNVVNLIFHLVTTLLGILGASLNLKKVRWAFIIYSIYALLYGLNAIYVKNYGEGVLNLLFNLPLYIYTTVKLLRKKNNVSNDSTFKINTLPIKYLIIIICLIPVVTIGYGFILKILNSNFPFINAFATTVALSCAFMASKAYKEQWIFWLIYSVILTILWGLTFSASSNSSFIYLVLNCFYLIINVYGLINWYKEYNKQKKQNI